MAIPQISIDFVILGTLALIVMYGVMAGQLAISRFAGSIYVGLVLANYFAEPLQKAIGTSSFGGFAITSTVTQLVLLVVPVVVLQLSLHRVHSRTKPQLLPTLILSILVALLAIVAVMMQFDDLMRARITEASNLASMIYAGKLLWLGGVPAAMVVIHFLHPKPDARKR